MNVKLGSVVIAALLIASLGLGWLYTDAGGRLSDLTAASGAQSARISELEAQLLAAREAWEMVNITKSHYTDSFKAQVTLEGTYESILSTVISGTEETKAFLHQCEVAHIYVPRDNVTLRIVASLRNATRNIPVYIFSGTDDMAASYSKPPLYLLEAKPGERNEFFAELPQRGWYSVSTYRAVIYDDPKNDYSIHVDMQVIDGYQSIPFVVRSYNPWE